MRKWLLIPYTDKEMDCYAYLCCHQYNISKKGSWFLSKQEIEQELSMISVPRELLNVFINKLSSLGQKHNMLILSACIKSEQLSMPRLVNNKTHLLFSASGLKLVHTSTLCCHTQMILLHFQLKGNVRGVNTYLEGCVLHVCSCDSRTVIHGAGGMCGIPHTHSFQDTNTGRAGNNAKYLSIWAITQRGSKQCRQEICPLSLAMPGLGGYVSAGMPGAGTASLHWYLAAPVLKFTKEKVKSMKKIMQVSKSSTRSRAGNCSLETRTLTSFCSAPVFVKGWSCVPNHILL